MDTLQNLIFLIIGALLTWFGTRWSKSTDTRTQLLIKIDNLVYDLTHKCSSTYFKYKNVNDNFFDELSEDMRDIKSTGYIGVAKALKIDGLVLQLKRFDLGVVRYFNSMMSLAFMLELEELADKGAQLNKIEINLGEVNNAAEEVHKVIAEEMIRIFPSISNYIKRFIAWIKSKV